MAFLFNNESAPPGGVDDSETGRLVGLLQTGSSAQRKAALARLVARRAEPALTACLASPDEEVAALAAAGLWDCWQSERGSSARRDLRRGVKLMDAGDLAGAERLFLDLMARFPDWAEAANKQATLLYLRSQPAVSLLLCRKVVALKPDHFGAWSGMALCALQLEDWPTALLAARQAVRLQPGIEGHREILQTALARLGLEE